MRVRADVFPAVLTIAEPGSLEDINELLPRGGAPKGSRKLDRCRIIVTDEKIMVAIDDPEGPKLVFSENVTFYSKEEKVHRVVTESGKMIAFRKDENCGCGSRLRSWSPYGSILMAQTEGE
jgi:hypothetical protein